MPNQPDATDVAGALGIIQARRDIEAKTKVALNLLEEGDLVGYHAMSRDVLALQEKVDRTASLLNPDLQVMI